MSTRAELQGRFIRALREFIAGAILNNQRLADQLGLNYTDHQVLNLIDMVGGAKPGELARRTGLTTGGVTVSLDRLERAGYIQRERNPQDRRSVIARMAPRRKKKIVVAYRAVSKVLEEIFADYSDTELLTVLSFFERANEERRKRGQRRENHTAE
jgi:MarR family transcriptional regulator, organic hydroperoxide resistance regulator